MKTIAAALLALTIATPAIASDLCYMVTEDGRRIPLGALCQGQTAPRVTPVVQPARTAPAPKPKLMDSLAFQNMRVWPKRVLMVVEGEIVNITNQPVRVQMVEFQFELTSGGDVLGSVVVPINMTLQPGQKGQIKYDMLRETTKGRAYNDVRVRPMGAI